MSDKTLDEKITEILENDFDTAKTRIKALMIEFAEKHIFTSADISKELDLWADKHGDEQFISFGYAFNDEFSEHLSGVMKENIRRKGE